MDIPTKSSSNFRFHLSRNRIRKIYRATPLPLRVYRSDVGLKILKDNSVIVITVKTIYLNKVRLVRYLPRPKTVHAVL